MSSILVVGQNNSLLARHIARNTKSDLVTYSSTQFADAEASIAIAGPQKIANKHIFLVYNFCSVAQEKSLAAGSINDQLMGLFACVDQLKQLGARSIKILLPYLPYSRQNEGVLTYDGMAFMIGRVLKSLGVASMYVCDLHAIALSLAYSLPLHNFSLERYWQRVIEKNIMDNKKANNFCIVSPDEGGRERAQNVATLLGCTTAFIRKTRPAQDAAICYELVGDVQGLQVVLVDDIIDTANTAISACDLVLAQGAEKVYGCFTHAILAEGASNKLASSQFSQIFMTDTLLGADNDWGDKIQTISINEYLSEAVQDLALQTSIF